jgi:hypothetical protein
MALLAQIMRRPENRIALTILGVLTALGSLVLLLPVWTGPSEHALRRDREETVRRRKRLRRAGRAWFLFGMSWSFLGALGVLAGVWLVLTLVCMCFPNTLVFFLPLLYGLPIFLTGWIWFAIVGVQDGIPWWWFLPRFRGTWMAEYVRENPERAANPFGLSMFGALVVVCTFGLLLLAEAIRNAITRVS